MEEFPLTIDALQKEYSLLDIETLKMHFIACKGALLNVLGMAPTQNLKVMKTAVTRKPAKKAAKRKAKRK